MSSQIDQNFVNQFSANVMHLSQQQGSKLQGTVRNETQKAEVAFYDRIGTVAAVVKAGRHSNTPQLDTPHSRRAVSLVDYEWADLIDDQDKIRSLNDPTNDYVMAAMWAMGRAKDDVIIDALGGSAYTGKGGTVAVALPDTQRYAANDETATSNLNVRTLRAIARKFDDADVPEGERYMLTAPSQVESMLGQTQVTSADYNGVKALVQGDVDTFMGFKFLKSTRLQAQVSALSGLGTTGAIGSGTSLIGYRKCYAYTKQGLLLAVGADMKARVSERDDKSYATQAYAAMSIGAVRMEEVKVQEVLCKES